MSLFTSYCFAIAAYLLTVERQVRLDGPDHPDRPDHTDHEVRRGGEVGRAGIAGGGQAPSSTRW
jgi:hypothetical protein